MKLFTLLKDIKTLSGLKKALETTEEEWILYQRTSASSWVLLSTDKEQRYYIDLKIDLLNSAMNEIRAYDRTLNREIRNKQRIRGNGYKVLCDYLLNIEYKII